MFTQPEQTGPRRPTILFLFIIIIIAVLIGGAMYCYECVELLKVRNDLTKNILDVLTKYLIIVIAIERSAYIYVNISRRSVEKKWLNRIDRVSRAINGKDIMDASGVVTNVVNKTFIKLIYKKENVILNELDDKTTIKPDPLNTDANGNVANNVNIEDVKGYLDAVIQIYKFKLSDHQTLTRRYVSRIVFFSGIVLAIFGISILGDLVYLPNMDSCNLFQCTGIRIFDILFTGGLIGGGSASFNKLIHAIQSALPSKNSTSESTL